MPRKRKSETHAAELLAPVPVEVLDQFVRERPLTGSAAAAADLSHRPPRWLGHQG